MTEYYNMNYGGKEVQVESAVRDEEGYSLKGCYAKKTEIKNGTLTINTQGGSTLGTFSANYSGEPVVVTLPNGTVQLLNQSVTFDTYTPTQAEIDDGTYAEFPYKASVSVTGVTASTYAEVTYSEEQATSLNFATSCDTATDVIYLYSRTNVGTVTIPTISIGMDYSDITIDATPTSGSGNAVSSGGVYTALQDYVTLGTEQDITASKYFKNTATYSSGTQYSNAIQFKTDNSGIVVGRINTKRTGTTSGSIFIEVLNPNTGEWKSSLEIDTDGTDGWASLTAYRAYNASNTGDVVTIGMLNSVANYSASKFSTGLGDTVPTQGILTYVRTGYKKGLLSGQIHIDSNTTSDRFYQMTLTTINTNCNLGVTLKAPSSTTDSGNWDISSDETALYGYGACVRIHTDGTIAFGRIYTTDGAFGAWPLSRLSNIWVNFNNVIVEEA